MSVNSLLYPAMTQTQESIMSELEATIRNLLSNETNLTPPEIIRLLVEITLDYIKGQI